MAVKFRSLSWHDLITVVLPALVLIVAAFWAASLFIKPAPPKKMVISTGGEGGAYQSFAAGYKEILSRYGIELVAEPSAGSLENLERLRKDELNIDAAFIQGGTASISENDALESLGDFYYEPLWIFYRDRRGTKAPLDQMLALKGKRIAIGNDGSGTQMLALEVLRANAMDANNTKLLKLGGLELVPQLVAGEVDAVMVVGPTQSAMVWTLLHTPGVQLMSLSHADAYVGRFPYLSRLTLPRGAIDLVRDIPPRDVQLVSPMTTLMVREGTHPALVGLLMQAASEIHGQPGAFQRPGEFPRAGHSDFPLSDTAERYYKSGKPFLQRYLPFWAATLVDRLVVMLVPIFAIMYPLFKFVPGLYSWRVRSRIYRRYGELKFLESELEETPDRLTREQWLARLDEIEAEVNGLPTPLAFADMLYTLRGHIAMVRESVMRLKPL